MSISDEQLATIHQQLGRQPRGLVSIAAQSAAGVPLVLKMRSLVDDKPFPTLYWLCSKDLCKAIGRIEGEGWVKVIETRLRDDAELRCHYLQDQQRYVSKRWQDMHPDDKQGIEGLKMTALFDQYGIGGITDWNKVRCLHMQYAHHLVEGNCIGALMDKQFGLQDLVVRL